MQKVMRLVGTMILVGATIGFCVHLEGVTAKVISGVLGIVLICLFLYIPKQNK
jgi:cadmium resistance protein CadD (predicted permease)